MDGFPIRVVIADDEPIARRGIRQLLGAYDDIRIVGEARNGKETARLLRSLSPDLVFLDVQMPEIDGFGVLGQIERSNRPETIFVTAHDEFAVRAFDARALDYLVKPVNEGRFRESLDRARERIHSLRAFAELSTGGSGSGDRPGKAASASSGQTRLVVRTGQGDVLVAPADILWIKAYDYYAVIHTAERRLMLRESLSDLGTCLDPTQFIQVHRSAIVNLSHVLRVGSSGSIEPTIVLVDGTKVPLSRRRRARLKAAIKHFAVQPPASHA